MERLIEEALPHIQLFLETIKIQEIRLQAYKAQNRLNEAVDLGLSMLATLEIEFPQSPTNLDIFYASMYMKRLLFRKSIQSLSRLPAMNDSNKLAAMQIMLSISPAIYAIRPKLLPLITFKRVELSIRHGNTLESIPTYASYGYLLCEKNIEQGYQFGQLALQLLAQEDAKILNARVFQIVYGVINHNKAPINATLQPLTEAYQSGLETGNFEYAAFSALTYLVHAFFIGKELNFLEQEMEKYMAVFVRLKQGNFLPILKIYHQTTLNLLNRADTAIYLVGAVYNEKNMIPLHQQAKERGLIFRVYFQKMMLCYLFNAHAEALDNALIAEEYLDSVIGSLLVPFFYFYNSLVRLAVFATCKDKFDKKSLRYEVMNNQKKLKKWARYAPMNYLHKFYLVEAEIARVLGRHCRASELYDKAIALARKNEYLNEEALALELAAKFYLQREQPRIAQVYLRDAHHAYNRWGAVAKVQALETEYPHLLMRWEKTTPRKLSVSTSTGTIDEAVTALDLTSVLKASQALAGEIVLRQLLEKLMRIVIESGGAQKGLLLLKENEQWVVEVKTVVDSQQVETLHTPLEENQDLSAGIVQYVARTKEYLVLNDADKTEQFSKDSYILKQRPKSTLCLPLIHQGQLNSILYLENRLTANVFTQTRLEMLRLLSSQMAISIENAYLYAGLEAKVKERTKDLERKNQELTQLNEQLVDLNREKDEFLGIAAHDLKNPLAGIQGLAELIEADLNHMPKEDILDIVKMISTGSRQMFDLIRNLLDVNVIETGRLSLNFQAFNLMSILSYLINQYQERAKVKQINLQFQPPQEKYIVFADEGTARQVLDNLISNAVKYSPSNTNVYLSIEQNTTHVRCAIKDEGPGLNEKDQQNLFKKFSRLTPQPTGNEHSTGLGLFIVHKLVKLMNGNVWCESEVGQGSTFFVEFPIASEDTL
jgi:signal transduction histidine kinase